MDYSKLSDFEINKLVAESLGSVDVRQLKNMISEVYCEINGVRCFRDFCNNPADAWPIILENKITVDPIGEAWQHKPHPQDYYYHEGILNNVSDKNPLRAAMIVFLMMNE